MALSNINTAWKSDIYPLIDKVFETEYRNRMSALRTIISEEDTTNAEYRLVGSGGFGELPSYSGTLTDLDHSRGFLSLIKPQEYAGAIDISYKYAKTDKSGIARRVGRMAAHSASMNVYGAVLRMFGNAFSSSYTGGDGKPWAATDHPVATSGEDDLANTTDSSAGTYSNLVTTELSVSAITAANSIANRYKTPDGLPLMTDFYNNGILLVAPELEGKAREICGPQAKINPDQNGGVDTFAANPVWGLRYMVIGGGSIGFTAKQWAIADAGLLRECCKIVYITRPTVIRTELDNPLVARVVPYVDFGVGWGDARCIIFSNPA